MRILVIGRGGREHAIVWALRKSPQIEKIYCAPGNGGIAELAECVAVQENQFAEISQFVSKQRIDLVVVGPDEPLSLGIVDYLEARNIAVYGPRQNAAILESSKVFAKSLFHKYNIPTANYAAFDHYDAALSYLQQQPVPIVIKADGLAAGKGVIVAATMAEAEEALRQIMVDQTFGSAGNKVVIEEFLQGQEMTLLAFVDGTVVHPMAPSQDHKPVFDNDLGPNTGGMGTYSPLPHVPQAVVDEVITTILKPVAEAMVKEGRPFRGVLYAGIMLTASGPKTIEFNSRFGDPEAQVVLPRLQTNLLDIILATLNGNLGQMTIRWSDEAMVCVILASEGYPGSYRKHMPISGLEQVEDALVFHAGTAIIDGKLVTNGGRVLGVVGHGATIAAAREQAYAQVGKIHYAGIQFRKDIAKKALIEKGGAAMNETMNETMNEAMIFNLMDIIRNRTIKWVEGVEQTIVDVQPANYNNTLHWNIGHVLTVHERLMFSFNGEPSALPSEYKDWFGNGTKPADWTTEPPSVRILLQQLGEQTARIRQTFQGRLALQQQKTLQDLGTIGEVLIYCLTHESMHQGYMNAMKKSIEA